MSYLLNNYKLSILILCLSFSFVVYVSSHQLNATGSIEINSLAPPISFAKGKSLSLLHIELQSVEEIPTSDHSPVRLRATIFPQQNLSSNLQVKWELPPEVDVLEGSVYLQLPALMAGQRQEVTLAVRNFSQEMRRVIGIQAFLETPDGRFGNSSVISSRPDDSFELLQSSASVPAKEAPARREPLKGRILR